MPITWTARTAAEANTWKSAAWSPSLGLFAAVAFDGTNQVMTSPDGITWTPRTAASSAVWRDVEWSPSLGLFAALGTNAAMSSTDGINWTSRTPPSSATWNSIAWAEDQGKFVAIASNNGTSITATSTNGTSWSVGTNPSVSGATSVTYADSIGLFVATISDIGVGKVMTSPDGATWTFRTITDNQPWSRVDWSPTLNLFVTIAGTGYYVTSSDGINWGSSSALIGTLADVIWSSTTNRFVVMSQSASTVAVHESLDGTNWTTTTSGVPTGLIQSLAESPDLPLVIAVSASTSNRVWSGVLNTTGTTGWYRSDIPGVAQNVAATQITS